MANPRISVIIPVYNSESFLEESIHSIIGQTFTDWELLLIDDGSSDRSIEIGSQYEKKDPRISLHRRSRLPKGPATCRNLGLGMASGHYIVFLDADDLLTLTALENRHQMLNMQADYDFMVFKSETFSNTPGDIGAISNIYPQQNSSYLKLFLQGLNPWQTQCPIWKRDFLLELGGWDENLKRITDPDIHCRALLKAGVRYSVMKDLIPDCFYRVIQDPLSRNDEWLINSIRGRIRFFKKMFAIIEDQTSDPKERNERKQALSRGIKDFIIGWLFSRLSLVGSDYEDLMDWIKQVGIIGRTDRIIIRWVAFLWKSDGPLIRIFRLKGLFTRFIS